MRFRFCFGASGAGKSYRLIQEVTRRAQAGLFQDQSFLYIVPEQYTMQTQKDLVMASPSHGIMNVDVLSFGRLSHRIFEEVGADPRVVLDDVGKSLILQRVAGSISGKLRVLGGRLGAPGMIAEVKSVISEFMQYDLGPSEVDALCDYARKHGQNALALKLEDLQLLYQAFLDYKKDHFLTGEETLDLLAEAIPKSTLIRHSVLVFDGFTGFTPVQYRVLEALLANAQEVIFSVTIAEDGGPLPAACEVLPSAGKQSSDEPVLLDPQDLFYLSRRTIREICAHAARVGVPHAADLYPGEGAAEPYRFRNSPALAHFERNLFRYPQKPFTQPTDAIQLLTASSVEEEVRQVCILVRQLVREEGFLYRDIGIIAGDLEVYGDEVRRMAGLYDLPVYVDRMRAVRQNPLTEAILGVLEIAGNDYSYATVFRYLRSGISSVTTEQVDRLENYCLSHGIASRKKWSLPFDADVEPARLRFLEELAPLKGRADRTARERTVELYQFLLGVQAEERMLDFAREAAEQHDVEHQQEYEQIYAAVIHLLEQIYALLGDEPISAEDYRNLLKAGFDEIRLGTLPQRVDRILVGDMERTRMNEVKVLFLVGVNDGSIPKSTEKGGLISDLDREFLDGSGIELAPAPREEMYIQRLYLYLNMTKPTRRLIVSYARMKPDGSSVRPSYLISMLRNLYPQVRIMEPEREEGLTRQLTGSDDAVRFLSDRLREYAAGTLGKEEEEFLHVLAWCTGPQAPPALRREVLARKDDAFLLYRPDRISPGTARQLYGRRLIGSVSRFETAVQCYRKHFLRYGLRLQERDEFTFEPADAGTVLHESIAAFSEQLAAKGLDWNTFTREEAASLVRAAVAAVAENYRHHLLTDSSRSQAGMTRAERILLRTVDTLQFQLQQGSFVPAAYEEPFGEHNEFRLALPGGGEVVLHGRIDRVDLCRKDGACWVKIIDYKTGNLDLDPELIRQGLRLQLVMYMDAELERQKGLRPDMQVKPAALLYYRFLDPVLQGKELDADTAAAALRRLQEEGTAPAAPGKEPYPEGQAEQTLVTKEQEGAKEEAETRDQDDREQEVVSRDALRRQLRPHGMVNGEDEAIELLDHHFTGTSMVIPVARTQKGAFRRGSRVFSEDEYRELSDTVREIIVRTAEEILDGNIALDPAVMPGSAGRTACTYCIYANACGYDPKTPGYHYRIPDPLHEGKEPGGAESQVNL